MSQAEASRALQRAILTQEKRWGSPVHVQHHCVSMIRPKHYAGTQTLNTPIETLVFVAQHPLSQYTFLPTPALLPHPHRLAT